MLCRAESEDPKLSRALNLKGEVRRLHQTIQLQPKTTNLEFGQIELSLNVTTTSPLPISITTTPPSIYDDTDTFRRCSSSPKLSAPSTTDHNNFSPAERSLRASEATSFPLSSPLPQPHSA